MSQMNKDLDSTASAGFNRNDVLLAPPETTTIDSPPAAAEAPSESPVTPPAMSNEPNHWTKDVHETGLWGMRSKKELYFCIAAILLMIGATVTGVVVAVHKSDNSSTANTKVDPVTGEVVSAYELPVPPPLTIISDQEELDIILSGMTSTNATLFAEPLSLISPVISELSTSTSTDPYVQAAIWLTTVDSYNAKEDALTRFALAVIYFSMQGSNWIQKENWLSPMHGHTQWFGVRGCEQLRGSCLCTPSAGDIYGRVLEVDLFRNNLFGTIPDAVALLPTLQSLYLSENRLTGTIPGVALGSLQNFSKFYAAYNFLTGTIPVELDQNGIFNTLFVQGNDITGFLPEELCSCPLCRDKLFYFGIDCLKIECSANCCDPFKQCYYGNNTITQLQ